METKWFARAGVGAFIAVAVTVTAIELRSAPEPVVRSARDEISTVDADPLHGELVRCQSIGAAGASDPSCLRAWAENRRRFLAPDLRRPDGLPGADDDVMANTADANAQGLPLAGGR